MACFLVPMIEAVAVTAVTKIITAKENKARTGGSKETHSDVLPAVPFSRRLRWLSNLLWGGVGLLALEHLWHGEITPWAPFLTAAGSSADTALMLREMSTTGVAMALLATAVWAVMLAVSYSIEKKAGDSRASEQKA